MTSFESSRPSQPETVRLSLPADTEEHREIVDHLIGASNEMLVLSPATALHRSIEGLSLKPQTKSARNSEKNTLAMHSAIMESGKFRTKVFAPNATLTNEGENLYNTSHQLPDFWTLAEVAPGDSPLKSHAKFITGMGKLLTAMPQLDSLYSDELYSQQHISNYAINEALWNDLIALSPKANWQVSQRYTTDTHQHSESLPAEVVNGHHLDSSYASDVGSIVKIVTTPTGREYSVQVSAAIPISAQPRHIFNDDYDTRAAIEPEAASVRKTLGLTVQTNRHAAIKERSIVASIELESSDVSKLELAQLVRNEPLRTSDGILSAEIYNAAIKRVAEGRVL